MNFGRSSAVQLMIGLALGLVAVGQGSPETRSNSLDMKFVRIAAGEFMAGSPLTEPGRSANETQHRVTISKPFWLAATHVTVAQFTVFTKESGYRTLAEKQGWSGGSWDVAGNKWERIDGGSWRNPGFPQESNHPVVCVTWNDAIAFCEWLGKKEGLEYRLPTEAEWEFASRAGRTTAYLWGNNPGDGAGWVNCSDLTSAAKFTLFPAFTWSDGFMHTSPVATFRPNAWGLSDMLGNTLQWCGDWFGDYPTDAVTDPKGPPEGKERVLRGGAFIYGPRHSRCAFRGRNFPDFQNFYIGFRVLLETGPERKTSP
jgi:formylglycine-generating enzyme